MFVMHFVVTIVQDGDDRTNSFFSPTCQEKIGAGMFEERMFALVEGRLLLAD